MRLSLKFHCNPGVNADNKQIGLVTLILGLNQCDLA